MKRETVLHVSDVAITTASVDIQVIRIGAKQMTLAVFRQLPYNDIFDECGALISIPWGWVNYDWSGAQQPFIYSYDSVLYRWDVNTEECYDVGIKPPKFEGGTWSIKNNEDPYRRLSFKSCFDSEFDANAYLGNRLKSLDTLKAAPQLFIAV